jgi:hypothetical protein
VDLEAVCIASPFLTVVVQRILRHANVSTTTGHYIRQSPLMCGAQCRNLRAASQSIA